MRSYPALLLVLLPLLAGLLAFVGALEGEFVYDDIPSIAENRAIRAGDWWSAAFGEDHSPIANRPLTCLTFAANHALGGLDTRGYHLVSLVLHLLNALLVLAVVRGCLLAANLRHAWSERRATFVATAAATLWAAHPLATDAVVYITQRTTLLMSCSLLVALLAVLRSVRSPRRHLWEALAVVGVALGMASKEEMVAAPILVILFERAFLWPDWEFLRRRWAFHVGLAATWLVLLACVWAGPSNPTVGYDTHPRATAFEWLMTEAPVVVHYLRLSVWPAPLRGAYDWPIVRDLAVVWLPGVLVLALLVTTGLLWRSRPAWGWLGALFFLLLAPTSTILPIVTEAAAERRMYLPMLAVLVPVVLGAERVLHARPVVGVAAGIAAVMLAIAGSRSHSRAYESQTAFWTDAYAKRTPDSRSFMAGAILSGYGKVLHEQGSIQEAHALFTAAMECEAPTPVQRLRYATALAEQGQVAEAETQLRTVLRQDPGLAAGNLAAVLLQAALAGGATGRELAGDPRSVEAERLLRTAIAHNPWRSANHNSLGYLLYRLERYAEAEAPLRQAIALEPDRVLPRMNLGLVLAARGRAGEAIVEWQRLLPALPRDVVLRLNLARAYAQLEDFAAARAMLEAVLAIAPDNAAARGMLQALPRER